AVGSSPQIKQASESAFAKHLRALGEHKVSYPAVDFVAQYGLFSKANNYQKFFARFQRNNATVGVAIRFPFLNFAQRAHAAAADARCGDFFSGAAQGRSTVPMMQAGTAAPFIGRMRSSAQSWLMSWRS